MTQKITNADIQKAVLKIIMKQDRFSEQDIIDFAMDLFEEQVDNQTIKKVVLKTIDYCRREIHLINIIDGGYQINPERKELVGAVFNHSGVTV